MAKKNQSNQTIQNALNYLISELGLCAKFMLPRLCLSCISAAKKKRRKKIKKNKIRCFVKTQVKLILKWGGAEVDQKRTYFRHKIDKV